MDNDFFRVVLPWPDWNLSPNARIHYQEKSAITKTHRFIAKSISNESLGFRNWIDADVAFTIWLFWEPNKIRRDTGNMRAAVKAYQDGVFDALKLDDQIIRDEYLHRAGIKKDAGGEIEFRIYEDYRQWLDDIIMLSSTRYGGTIYTVQTPAGKS